MLVYFFKIIYIILKLKIRKILRILRIMRIFRFTIEIFTNMANFFKDLLLSNLLNNFSIYYYFFSLFENNFI